MNKKVVFVLFLIIVIFIIILINSKEESKKISKEENKIDSSFIANPGEKPEDVIVDKSSGELKKIVIYENNSLKEVSRIISKKLNTKSLEIGKKEINLNEYDVIFLGCEIVDDNISEKIISFLDKDELIGKIIIPFVISDDIYDFTLREKINENKKEINTENIEENELKLTYEEENLDERTSEWLEEMEFIDVQDDEEEVLE